MQRIRDLLADWLYAERDRLALWLPVFMGAGVLTYYSLRFEPPLWLGAALTVVALPAAILCRQVPWLRGATAALAAFTIGVTACQFATMRAPPLETGLPTHATVLTGVVRAIEPLPNGRRITIEDVHLDGAAAPLRRSLRVRLRNNDPADIATGDLVRVRALVRTPAPPTYPGGWDLQRDAFYAGLGGSGYALGPVERLAQAAPTGLLRGVQRLREVIAGRVAAAIPGAAGGFAVTLLTGFQNGIPAADHDAFRISGLAHLLAVAGLHIGIVMGFTMFLARTALALSEHASLFWPTKQIAGLIALAAGLFYMLLTGMHVPIVRSFAMASLFTLALLTGRRVISLRGLALAATTLMLIEPEQVPDVSFQMSFSAVLALIAGYEALRPWLRRLHGASPLRRFTALLVTLALTSALAGTASAPFGAYHFGRVQVYFIVANMAAVPLTAFWVLPLGLLSLPLMMFHLERLALVPMGWGAHAVVWIARLVAAWPASTVAVPHMPAWGLAVLSVGLAWLGLWRTRLRLAGVLAIAIGLASPAMVEPPQVLVSDDARLIAVRTPAGVFVQQVSGGSKFVRDAWLQYWATDRAGIIPKTGLAAGGAIDCGDDACLLRPRVGAHAVLLARGTARRAECSDIAVIVSAEPARGLCPRPWPSLVDRFTVWRYGSTAIWLDGARASVLTDRQARGDRPWVPPMPQARRRVLPRLPVAPVDARR
ncbi:MAG TPA: ComEC/Rec2 family competence protein [Acetobacteraceae bacterium]|jgi:competence protein ComEC